jgi:hypothetical protein
MAAIHLFPHESSVKGTGQSGEEVRDKAVNC